ncbi:hypothetical protein IIA29_04925 [candidate division KSB1 bacterium]|nr:hypothetical protein [candidate division KSB1 bacterium]
MSNIARMHTAEHLLSAVMRKHFHASRNLELHLGEKKTKCDYPLPRALSNEDIRRIEQLVNDEITKDHPVFFFFIKRDEAAAYDLWKVPQESDEIRIVKIGDFDAQPCSGKHVSHTSEIGVFRITSCDLRDNGRLRIRFKTL